MSASRNSHSGLSLQSELAVDGCYTRWILAGSGIVDDQWREQGNGLGRGTLKCGDVFTCDRDTRDRPEFRPFESASCPRSRVSQYYSRAVERAKALTAPSACRLSRPTRL